MYFILLQLNQTKQSELDTSGCQILKASARCVTSDHWGGNSELDLF